MKAIRFLMALLFALAVHTSPVPAGQGTIVGPTAGPKTMAEVMGTINAAFLAIQSCNSGSSAPANGVGSLPTQYQCWADTSGSPTIAYKYYDGASWVTFGTLNTSTHVWTPYRAGAPIVAVATSGSASDLSTGTLPAARLPNPSASSLGGVQSKTCSTSQWLNDISTGGVLSCAQPNFTDLAGTASLAQLPAFSGMTAAAAASDTDSFPTNQGAGNLKQTLAAVKTWIKAWIVKADVGLGNVDNTSDATKNAATATLTNKTLTSPVINTPTGIVKGDVGLGNVDNTSDATKWAATKTLTNTTYNCGSTGNVCTVRFADITGFGTGVSTALGVNVGSAGAVVVNGGALGTPSSGVATNLTGTAPGLTAGNVTTNANLTGDVTSVGNATTLTNAPVIAKVLTAFSAAAGTVSSSDSILAAFQKIVGNLALKADLASPALTGSPTAPTQAANDNSTKIATTAYVNGATRERLTSARTYYVRTDGSNSNTGLSNTAGGAFLTVQRALDVIFGTLDLGGFNVSVQLGDGTYTTPVIQSSQQVGAGTVTITGNASTPDNVIIDCSSATCFTASDNVQLIVLNLKVQGGFGLTATRGGSFQFGNVVFGTCTSFHIQASDGGRVTALSNYSIVGGASAHLRSSGGGIIRARGGLTITITGTPAFSSAVVSAATASVIFVDGNTFSGSATGPRYSAVSNAVISVNGAGATYLPGDTSGSAATGGQYL